MKAPSPSPRALSASRTAPADQTRAALVHAGLKLFGRQGFSATSTRDIAALAKANIGSIAYHFGGKDGLHEACADFIVDAIRGIAQPALDDDGEISTVDGAHARLTLAVERMVSLMVASPEAGDIAQFIMRELAQPSAALDRIYAGVFEPTHRQLCQVWHHATGDDPDSEATKLTVFTLIGQVVYFRIAREAVMRRMGWDGIEGAQAAAIAAVVKRNLDAMLGGRGRGGSSFAP